MLNIGSDTYAKLESADLERFLSSLTHFLRENVPDMEHEPERNLRQQILFLREDARQHDIVGRRPLALYVITAALLGTDFVDRYSGVRQILFTQEDEEIKAALLAGFTATLFDALKGGDA
ncbi:hypothetical protein [Erythrobacter sp. NFXS35]|uniref:hypothetical protein n=1 Tax=Erythrobacter sp. NFXS35 TaxID=2818436 RepID=UPI0032E038C0